MYSAMSKKSSATAGNKGNAESKSTKELSTATDIREAERRAGPSGDHNCDFYIRPKIVRSVVIMKKSDDDNVGDECLDDELYGLNHDEYIQQLNKIRKRLNLVELKESDSSEEENVTSEEVFQGKLEAKKGALSAINKFRRDGQIRRLSTLSRLPPLRPIKRNRPKGITSSQSASKIFNLTHKDKMCVKEPISEPIILDEKDVMQKASRFALRVEPFDTDVESFACESDDNKELSIVASRHNGQGDACNEYEKQQHIVPNVIIREVKDNLSDSSKDSRGSSPKCIKFVAPKEEERIEIPSKSNMRQSLSSNSIGTRHVIIFSAPSEDSVNVIISTDTKSTKIISSVHSTEPSVSNIPESEDRTSSDFSQPIQVDDITSQQNEEELLRSTPRSYDVFLARSPRRYHNLHHSNYDSFSSRPPSSKISIIDSPIFKSSKPPSLLRSSSPSASSTNFARIQNERSKFTITLDSKLTDNHDSADFGSKLDSKLTTSLDVPPKYLYTCEFPAATKLATFLGEIDLEGADKIIPKEGFKEKLPVKPRPYKSKLVRVSNEYKSYRDVAKKLIESTTSTVCVDGGCEVDLSDIPSVSKVASSSFNKYVGRKSQATDMRYYNFEDTRGGSRRAQGSMRRSSRGDGYRKGVQIVSNSDEETSCFGGAENCLCIRKFFRKKTKYFI